MITAIDTSVLLDVLGGAEPHGPASGATLRRCIEAGSIVASDVVWAEVAPWFAAPADLESALDVLGVRYVATSAEAAAQAGRAWGRYRAAGGPRQRLVADFLVGAHAALQADRLLTRDRGFFRRYFRTLAIIDPTSS